MRERVHRAGAQLRPRAGSVIASGSASTSAGRTSALGPALGAGRQPVDAVISAPDIVVGIAATRRRSPRRPPSRRRSPGRRRARPAAAPADARSSSAAGGVGDPARGHLMDARRPPRQSSAAPASARGVLSSSNSATPCSASTSGACSTPPRPKTTVRPASRQVKSPGPRHPAATRGLRDRAQVRLDLVAQVLVVGRQRELLAEVLERLVDGEAGAHAWRSRTARRSARGSRST